MLYLVPLLQGAEVLFITFRFVCHSGVLIFHSTETIKDITEFSNVSYDSIYKYVGDNHYIFFQKWQEFGRHFPIHSYGDIFYFASATAPAYVYLSKKRQTQALLVILQSGTLCVVVFTTHTAALQNQIGAVMHRTCIWWNLWVIFCLINQEMCQSQILTQRMSLKTGVWQKRVKSNVFMKNECTNLTS